MAFDTRLSSTTRKLFAISRQTQGFAANLDCDRTGEHFRDDAHARPASMMASSPYRLQLEAGPRFMLLVGQQIFDQALQGNRVVANDAYDIGLLRRHLSDDAVDEKFRSLTHRCQRRLQLV